MLKLSLIALVVATGELAKHDFMNLTVAHWPGDIPSCKRCVVDHAEPLQARRQLGLFQLHLENCQIEVGKRSNVFLSSSTASKFKSTVLLFCSNITIESVNCR